MSDRVMAASPKPGIVVELKTKRMIENEKSIHQVILVKLMNLSFNLLIRKVRATSTTSNDCYED